MNLLQIETRIRQLEGHENDDSYALRSGIRSDINEVYLGLANERPWYWWVSHSVITPAAGGATALMPANLNQILWVMKADKTFLEARDIRTQLQWSAEIQSKTIQSYALDGVDGTTGYVQIALWPAYSSDITAYYTITPTELSADTDTPDGPEDQVSSYLVWATRYLRLLGDEEREGLIEQSRQRSEMILRRLAARNMQMMRSLPIRPAARNALP